MANSCTTCSFLGPAFALVLASCDMPAAEVLSEPRLLALRAEPAALAPGEPLTLEALTFAVDGDVAWSACPVAWAPTEPLSCPGGAALALGTGNPLTVTAPADRPSLWIRAEADGALPAVKLLEATSTAANPAATTVLAATDAGTAALPASLARGATLDLVPGFADGVDAASIVTSWYVTGGTLDPKRTVGLDPATLTAPDTAGPLTIIGVLRTKAGGTAWVTTTVEVTP